MNTYRSPLLFLALLALFLSPAIHAAPVTWYLNGVTFSDGSRAVGSFVYDTVTGLYTSIDITTTPGTRRRPLPHWSRAITIRCRAPLRVRRWWFFGPRRIPSLGLRHAAVGVSGNTLDGRRNHSAGSRFL